MKNEIRSSWIKLRVSPAEKETIVAKAEAQGQSVTDFLRQRALDYRLRQTPLEKGEYLHKDRFVIHLLSIGGELCQGVKIATLNMQ